MTTTKEPVFNELMRKVIEKSLFTERQIEILLSSKDCGNRPLRVSRGAYYRQLTQSRRKFGGFYYTFILLQGLGLIHPSDTDVMRKVSEQLSVIGKSDVSQDDVESVINVVDLVIQRALKRDNK